MPISARPQQNVTRAIGGPSHTVKGNLSGAIYLICSGCNGSRGRTRLQRSSPLRLQDTWGRASFHSKALDAISCLLGDLQQPTQPVLGTQLTPYTHGLPTPSHVCTGGHPLPCEELAWHELSTQEPRLRGCLRCPRWAERRVHSRSPLRTARTGDFVHLLMHCGACPQKASHLLI